MLLQFKVIADESLWIADTQFLTWARVSTPGTDPESKVLELGKLIPRGFGIYVFEHRSAKTPGPGAGLCSLGVNLVGIGQTIKVYIRTNVAIKDFTMPAPIRQILYEIMPSDPQQIEQSIQEISDGPDSRTDTVSVDPVSHPSGDRAVDLDPETTEETRSGETGLGAPDGGSLGGVASGIGGY